MATAVKSLLVSDVPRFDYVSPLPLQPSNFQLIGHRGNGMHSQSQNSKVGAMKENSILSFNQAGRFPINLVEFDVQVTRDNHVVIFHDITILTDGDNGLSEHRVTDLSLEEFLSYGPQKATGHHGKNEDDSLCTLQEHVVFSSFHPDAVRIIHETQSSYPVLFLTEAGIEMYSDLRRNSMDAAIELCSACGLQGIVSDVRGVFRDPSVIGRIKEAGLKLYTYGEMNNIAQAVYVQHLMGIDGVIVDLVREITEAVAELISGEGKRRGGSCEDTLFGEGGQRTAEMALSRLRPELVQRV